MTGWSAKGIACRCVGRGCVSGCSGRVHGGLLRCWRVTRDGASSRREPAPIISARPATLSGPRPDSHAGASGPRAFDMLLRGHRMSNGRLLAAYGKLACAPVAFGQRCISDRWRTRPLGCFDTAPDAPKLTGLFPADVIVNPPASAHLPLWTLPMDGTSAILYKSAGRACSNQYLPSPIKPLDLTTSTPLRNAFSRSLPLRPRHPRRGRLRPLANAMEGTHSRSSSATWAQASPAGW